MGPEEPFRVLEVALTVRARGPLCLGPLRKTTLNCIVKGLPFVWIGHDRTFIIDGMCRVSLVFSFHLMSVCLCLSVCLRFLSGRLCLTASVSVSLFVSVFCLCVCVSVCGAVTVARNGKGNAAKLPCGGSQLESLQVGVRAGQAVLSFVCMTAVMF